MVCLNEIILGKWGKRMEQAGWQRRSGLRLGPHLLQIHTAHSTTAWNSVGIYRKNIRWPQFWPIGRWMLLSCLNPKVRRGVVYTWALILSVLLPLLVEADRGFDESLPGLCLLVSVYKDLWCYKVLSWSEKIKFWWKLQPSRWFGVALCSWSCNRNLLALVEWTRNQKTPPWNPRHGFLNSPCEGSTWVFFLIRIKRKIMQHLIFILDQNAIGFRRG